MNLAVLDLRDGSDQSRTVFGFDNVSSRRRPDEACYQEESRSSQEMRKVHSGDQRQTFAIGPPTVGGVPFITCSTSRGCVHSLALHRCLYQFNALRSSLPIDGRTTNLSIVATG